MKTLYFATSNDNKFKEIRKLIPGVKQLKVELREMKTDDIKKLAIEKAKEAFQIVKKPVFIEDTGFFVNALNGFPGTNAGWIYKKLDGFNGVLKLMDGIEDRSATFVTVVSYFDGKKSRNFVGQKKGEISTEARGSDGWGYDPVFIPEGRDRTYAELGITEKNRISHRSIAIGKFLEWIKNGK